MLTLKRQPPLLFTLLGSLLAMLAMCTAFLGFQVLAIAYFSDEPIMLGLLAVNLLIALWLIIGTLRGYLLIESPRHYPLAMIWLAWLGWQLFTTLFADIPIRSLMGPTEQCEGLAWYIMVTMLMLLFSALWDTRYFKGFILYFSLAIMSILAVLHFLTDPGNNLFSAFMPPILSSYQQMLLIPFIWPDYLAYLIGWWWIAARLAKQKTPGWELMLQLLLIWLCLIASSNRSAIVIIGISITASVAITFVHRFVPRLFATPTLSWRRLSLTALLLPLFWLLLCAWPGFKVNYNSDNEQSIPIRVLLNNISLSAIADEPQRLLLGHGWGSFQDDFFKYSLVRDVSVYQNGVHNPNWKMIRGHNYHTHNTASEILLSLGLIGLILWIAMPMVVLARLPGNYFWSVAPAFIGITFLQHWWFPMPQAIPYQALCWFLIMRRCAPARKPAIITPGKSFVGLALCLALIFWAMTGLYKSVTYTTRILDPFGIMYGDGMMSAEEMEKNIPYGGDHLRAVFILYTKRLFLNQESVEEKHIILAEHFLEAMKSMADNPRSGAYNSSIIHYFYNVAFTNARSELYSPLLEDARTSYEHYALLHTKRAPHREDIIAPYLMALADNHEEKHEQHLMGFLQQLLAINPSHRSALWLSGKILARQNEYHKQGVEMMRTALELGAAKVYGITDAEVEALKKD